MLNFVWSRAGLIVLAGVAELADSHIFRSAAAAHANNNDVIQRRRVKQVMPMWLRHERCNHWIMVVPGALQAPLENPQIPNPLEWAPPGKGQQGATFGIGDCTWRGRSRKGRRKRGRGRRDGDM